MPPIDERPEIVHCAKCGQTGYANEAEMADETPYRCLKCGFTWRPFSEANDALNP